MITLRFPEESEHYYLIELRNKNRQYFFDQERVTFKEHYKWYNIIKDFDYFFVIELDGNLIGTICLYSPVGNTAEYGRFIIDEKFRNNGYGRQALTKLLKYAFALGITKVYGDVWTDNTNAIKLDKSLGFREEKTFDLNGRSVTRMVINK